MPASSGAELLDALHAALSRYVVFPSPEAAHAATLWIAATHAQAAWEHAPRLAAISAVKRSGKSRLMDVVAETAHKPLITVNATIAALARSIDPDDPPTLLVDEADESSAPGRRPSSTTTSEASSTPATSATGRCCAGT